MSLCASFASELACHRPAVRALESCTQADGHIAAQGCCRALVLHEPCRILISATVCPSPPLQATKEDLERIAPLVLNHR